MFMQSRQAAHRPADAKEARSQRRCRAAGAARRQIRRDVHSQQLHVPELHFRSKSKLRAIYDVVASITAEEVGHVELVANGVAMLNNGPDSDETGGADISDAPFDAMQDIRLAASFFSNGGGAMPVDSNGLPWNGTFVTTTGNVIMDMLFNFHLECGARLHKLRVYETMTEPTGREVCGYLLVRGSVHAHAYALVLKQLTGVAIEKMLPVPKIDLGRIPECQKYLVEGRHRWLYTNSPPIIRRWPASGATAKPRCRATRQGTRGGRGCPGRRQDPRPQRPGFGVHARVRA